MQDKEIKYYSQGLEEKHITEFFGEFKGTLLSIGENDGRTFSNALKLIENNWTAILVEPSPIAFDKLVKLHKEMNSDAICLNVAIGNSCGKATLFESGHHLKNKSDIALLSSLEEKETEKWKKAGVNFNEIEVDMIDYLSMCSIVNQHKFDFITIDAEGNDLQILKQIDLSDTKLLCIEWNSKEEIKKEILEYCTPFGMNNIIYQSGENILLAR